MQCFAISLSYCLTDIGRATGGAADECSHIVKGCGLVAGDREALEHSRGFRKVPEHSREFWNFRDVSGSFEKARRPIYTVVWVGGLSVG